MSAIGPSVDSVQPWKEPKAIFGAIMIENFSKLMSDTKNTDPENSEYSK